VSCPVHLCKDAVSSLPPVNYVGWCLR
jgi:hypothetical protein